MTGEPNVSFPGFADPAEFQIDLALNQLDGSYAAPFGLLGSQWNSGTATSPWKDANGAPIPLPGSLMIGGSGEDFLIGNSGNDTLIGGTPALPKAGVIDEVLVGGGAKCGGCRYHPTKRRGVRLHVLGYQNTFVDGLVLDATHLLCERQRQ